MSENHWIDHLRAASFRRWTKRVSRESCARDPDASSPPLMTSTRVRMQILFGPIIIIIIVVVNVIIGIHLISVFAIQILIYLSDMNYIS